MPRRPEGSRPLTDTERNRRAREKRAAEREQMISALRQIIAARTAAEARKIALAALPLD